MYLEHSTPYRNIHGHVHSIDHHRDGLAGALLGEGQRKGYYFNACVEKINYTPVTLDYIGRFLDTSDLVKKDEGEE
jgi:calcineurin-like phosphoesterase family protein